MNSIDHRGKCALEFTFRFPMLHTAEASYWLQASLHESPRTEPHPLGKLTWCQALLFFIHSRIAFYRILRRRPMRWKPTFIHWRLLLQKCWVVINVLFLQIGNRLITKKTELYATTLKLHVCIRWVHRSKSRPTTPCILTDFPLHSSFRPGKCRHSTSVRPRPLPSNSIAFHQSSCNSMVLSW